MKKILIAGAGHGGLAVAAFLAEKGYDVRLYERKRSQDLGYDWDDAISNKTFSCLGIDFNNKDVMPRESAAFYSPSLKTPVIVNFPPEETTYEIQRKVMYRYLLINAEKKGVKMYFDRNISKALISGDNKVMGIIVDGEEIAGDLVIDSAGMYSPVRSSLPESYKMIEGFGRGEVFHTYRAIFDLLPDKPITNADKFNFYFRFNNIEGIAWYKIVDGRADILIGSVVPLTEDEIAVHIEELRKAQPSIGRKLLAAGYVSDIPLRAAFSVMTGDNYASIGDAVSMTIPINGSGITNSIRAGRMLADTIIDINQRKTSYNKENLWNYQVRYMKEIGADMISVDIIKRCILTYPSEIIDYFFDRGIIAAKELLAGALGYEMKLSLRETLEKLFQGFMKLPMLIRLNNALLKSRRAKQHVLKIPNVYHCNAIEKWADKYEAFLK